MVSPIAPTTLRDLEALLSEDEKKRAARFIVDEPRVNFITSRGTLRLILGRYLDADPRELEFEYAEHGKPSLAGRHEDTDLDFNVSHSGDVIVHGIARGRALGIDVERIRTDFDYEKLAERYFSPAEGDKLRTETSEQERPEAFYHCWTRKEAYLKLKGAGLSFPLDRFQVTLLPDEEPALVYTEIDGDDPEQFIVRDIPVHEAYLCAIITTKPEPNLRLWDWQPDPVPAE